ncbi:MAG: class I SAM-dependent methyltransferase [Fimbriimonadaceae bacterium]|nr:class I SAM-dependent methyltransferase [Chitinophagales bacterium]
MKRIDIAFEFEDLACFPNTIRESMTDFLRYFLTAVNFYKPIIPIINEALNETATDQIIDLCSGGGGPVEKILDELKKETNKEIKILLTDKYPNKNAFEFLAKKTNAEISFSNISIDATNVPPEMKGFRTIFSGFHHFNEPLAKSVIKNAVDCNTGIGIFDGGDKNIFLIIGIILFQPIAFFLFTPFFKPFRFSRIFFTYIIPIIPLCTIWDGIISILRLYNPAELLQIAKEVENEKYIWQAGKVRNKLGMHVTYLVGYPVK